MFEKEAEEIVYKKLCSKAMCYNHCNFSSLKHHRCGEWHRCYESAKDGAEFGYNKANEWHYVKDEFPPENVPLNIITLDKNKKRRLWVGEYKGGNGEYWSGYFNHFIDVPYAWKEIVLPKEEE